MFLDYIKQIRQNYNINHEFKNLKRVVLRIKEGQFLVTHAKIEILCNFWDQIIGYWFKYMSKQKNKELAGATLLQKVVLVPKEVRLYVLRTYIR